MSDRLVEVLPLPQRLALTYAPRRSHAPLLALLALDARLAAVVRSHREPIAAQLRLAWWRDRLSQTSAPGGQGEPVLEALGAWPDPSSLLPLVDGWESLLVETVDAGALMTCAQGRADAFASLAQQLGEDREAARGAGLIWSLADLAAHPPQGMQEEAVARGRELQLPTLPAALRPLAVLAALGAGALRRGGGPLLRGPGSLLTALRTGLIGR